VIKVAAAPINPSDEIWTRGFYPLDTTDFPRPCGFEGAGRIIKVGEGVDPK